MNGLVRFALVAVAVSTLSTVACSHAVNIKSVPPGATIYIDGEERGETPIQLDEENGFFDQREVRMELDGHQAIETVIYQTEPVWSCVAPSVCLAPFTLFTSCAGLQWATKYAEEYEFVMDPIRKDGGKGPTEPEKPPEDLDTEMTIPY